jgi:hypothetical protein
MSASLRDERVKLYTYSNTGTGGRATPRYTFSVSRWARRAIPGSREATVAGQASQQVDAVFILPDRVGIDADGAIRAQDGTLYKITGVMPVRNTASIAEQIVFATYAAEMSLSVSETP